MLRTRAGAAEREREIVAPAIRLHDLGGLARLRRRQGRVAVRGGAGRGFTHVKMKVGADLESDDRRAGLIRARARRGRRSDDGREPGLGRRPGDRGDAAAGRARPVVDRGADESRRRARPRAHPPRGRADRRRHGRACPEPRDLQAAVPGRRDRRLPDRRLPARRRQRGVAVLLLAAKFGVPVCPHAGGVGLCEYVQHLAIFDYIAVSGSLEDRVVE